MYLSKARVGKVRSSAVRSPCRHNIRSHTIGREIKYITVTAGGQYYRGRLEQDELAGFAPVAERPGNPITVLDQLGDRAFGEDLDPGVVSVQRRNISFHSETIYVVLNLENAVFEFSRKV